LHRHENARFFHNKKIQKLLPQQLLNIEQEEAETRRPMKDTPFSPMRMTDLRTLVENKDNQEKACRTAAPVATFWAVMNVIQRSAGGLGYYSGRKGSLILGSAAVALGSMASNYVCTQVVYPSLGCCSRSDASWWSWVSGAGAHRKRLSDEHIGTNEHTMGLAACRTVLTVALYSLLSLNWCQTAFPSSVITIGSYAKGELTYIIVLS
jgi:hypothetical protein